MMPTKKQLQNQVEELQRQIQIVAEDSTQRRLDRIAAQDEAEQANERAEAAECAAKKLQAKSKLQGVYLKALRQNGAARDHQIKSTIWLVGNMVNFMIDQGVMTEGELGGRGF